MYTDHMYPLSPIPLLLLPTCPFLTNLSLAFMSISVLLRPSAFSQVCLTTGVELSLEPGELGTGYTAEGDDFPSHGIC